ncbi:efflux RND transporter periplasmic adaptor subunit [Pseudoalteromonas fenneropenaei]|uniref:Efflux RND transporter periplasmic adaptor subunit n=1 Tax=Pseudoalteromonas fenneropenaei TaxID=1737459 RepID=A0ABV7CKT4_9GAMM
MDTFIKKKKPSIWQKYRVYISSGLVLVVLGVFFVTKSLATVGFHVDRDSIVISNVKKGEFKASVKGPGILAPNNVRWLSSRVDGHVERVLVKAGDAVVEGQALLELSNPKLVREREEAQWEYEAQESDIKAQLAANESQLLDQKAMTLESKSAYDAVKLRFDAESELLEKGKGAISLIDYKRTKLQMEQYKERWEIEIVRFEKLKKAIKAQNDANQARLNKMANTLEKVQQQVAGLTLRATMNAVVQEIPNNAGQKVSEGEPIAKLAKQDELYAVLSIPEIQIGAVQLGQKVTIDTRNNKIVGSVLRIDPSVRDGVVKVDVLLNEQLPSDARPDLSIEGDIEVAYLPNALSVARPTFSQSHSITSLYKINKESQTIERVVVKFGQGASDRIQIIDGLEEGDQIVISDTSSWDNHQNIRIRS